jgi:aminoglycoside/choline kinase family phosphotransferase
MTLSTIAPARLEQIKQFLSGTPFKDAQLYPLAGDASFRRYVRLSMGNESAMLMDAPPEKENVSPFIAVAEFLHQQGFSAPFIHARHEQNGFLLLEDLGDDSFSSVLKKSPAQEEQLYAAAIDVLAHWHKEEVGFSKPELLVLPHYNQELLMREVALFTDWFLPQVAGADKAQDLSTEYLSIWQAILANANLATTVWVHRDYHADNLMWLPQRKSHQRVGLLDFQDGVYGDAAYDLVSLLEDARRDVPPALATAMLERYINEVGINRQDFLTSYAVLGAQRNCKIIGIFSRLAVRDGKFSYLNFLPRVWRHLENDLKHPLMAPLKQWIDNNVPADKRGVISVSTMSAKLTA